jgi:hypothetical protein
MSVAPCPAPGRRTLRVVAREFPNLQTRELFGDFPVFADTSVAGTADNELILLRLAQPVGG